MFCLETDDISLRLKVWGGGEGEAYEFKNYLEIFINILVQFGILWLCLIIDYINRSQKYITDFKFIRFLNTPILQ